jgi:putative peptidoglycan lipid II flippase
MPLPGAPAYPLEAGTASALYFGQRMYQFPLGLFGVALGTVLFPILARHAERGALRDLRNDLLLGLKLITVIGLPASLGLVLLAERLTALLFRHGAFDAADARQTSAMIACYGVAVWAYGGLLIIHRGFYAVGDRQTPLRIGLLAVVLNLALSLTLIWIIGGTGLALATSIAAMLQVVVAMWLIQHRVGGFNLAELSSTLMRAVLATALMGGACLVSCRFVPAGVSLAERAVAVFGPLLVSIAVYAVAARMLGLSELELLFRRERSGDHADSD